MDIVGSMMGRLGLRMGADGGPEAAGQPHGALFAMRAVWTGSRDPLAMIRELAPRWPPRRTTLARSGSWTR